MRTKEVIVPERYRKRCQQYGHDLKAMNDRLEHRHRAGSGGRPNTHHDFGGNPDRSYNHAIGKMREVAGALALGLDPDRDINWEVTTAGTDAGRDLVFRCIRIDVKGSRPRSDPSCIWPVQHDDKLAQDRFDVILYVEAADLKTGWARVGPWITRERFIEIARRRTDWANARGVKCRLMSALCNFMKAEGLEWTIKKATSSA